MVQGIETGPRSCLLSIDWNTITNKNEKHKKNTCRRVFFGWLSNSRLKPFGLLKYPWGYDQQHVNQTVLSMWYRLL